MNVVNINVNLPIVNTYILEKLASKNQWNFLLPSTMDINILLILESAL